MSTEKREFKLVGKKQLTEKMWLFELGLDGEYAFEAGQYVSLKVSDEGERRAYSIANKPGEKRLEIVADVSPAGIGSKFLLDLKEGDRVEVLGPLGKFVVKESKDKRLFLATGSGVAPLRAMIEDLLVNKGNKEEIELIWGLRYEKDIFWKERFERLEKDFKNFQLEIMLSRPGHGWMGKTGYVTDCLKSMDDLKQREIYICGNPEMLESVKVYLKKKGVADGRIHFEKYV